MDIWDLWSFDFFRGESRWCDDLPSVKSIPHRYCFVGTLELQKFCSGNVTMTSSPLLQITGIQGRKLAIAWVCARKRIFWFSCACNGVEALTINSMTVRAWLIKLCATICGDYVKNILELYVRMFLSRSATSQELENIEK